jgi:hypothetical protein
VQKMASSLKRMLKYLTFASVCSNIIYNRLGLFRLTMLLDVVWKLQFVCIKFSHLCKNELCYLKSLYDYQPAREMFVGWAEMKSEGSNIVLQCAWPAGWRFFQTTFCISELLTTLANNVITCSIPSICSLKCSLNTSDFNFAYHMLCLFLQRWCHN